MYTAINQIVPIILGMLLMVGASYVKTHIRLNADSRATAHELLAEMSRMEEQMDSDRTESERLKLETQVINATIEAKLTRLEVQVSNMSKVK